MKKIGLLSLALVLALGTLGIAYAAWTDTVIISGNVTTGDVDLNAVYFSSTEVWKDLDTGDAVTVHYITDAAGNVVYQDGTVPSNGFLVASAYAGPGDADDTVSFNYTNLFPCQDLMCDVFLHYDGSVPVKVNNISWEYEGDGCGDWVTPLALSGNITGLARRASVDEGPPFTFQIFDNLPVVESTQLEYCDWVWVALMIHLPQDETLMNRSASGTATIEVIQWNEY